MVKSKLETENIYKLALRKKKPKRKENYACLRNEVNKYIYTLFNV